MDDIIVGLVDGIGDTLIEKDLMKKAGVDAVKDNVRSYIDGAVAKKISDNYYKALDKDGKRDPILYAQLVADSIQGALTDKDFQKGYEAVATYWALASLIKDTRDSLKDARKDFANSVDKKFQADFAAKYTALVDEYIDTLDTAAAKALKNDAAKLALDALLLPGNTAYNTNVDQAKKDYDKNLKDHQTWLDNRAAISDARTLTNETNMKLAQLDYDKVMKDPASTDQQKKDAIEQYAKDCKAYADEVAAIAAYDEATAKQDKIDLKNFKAAYDKDMREAEYDHEVANIEARQEWIEAGYEFETINPWGDVNYYTFPNVGSWN
jgi:hypothetical protein